jgi:hypothetical protein
MTSQKISKTVRRGFFFQTGFYYPLFFIQLDSVKHGLSDTFSFYSVGYSATQMIFLLTASLVSDSKRVQLCGTSHVRVHRDVYGSPKLNHSCNNFGRCAHFGHGWIE